MKHSQTTSEKDLFENTWLHPIMHNNESFSTGKMGLEIEMHAFDSQTHAPLGTQNASLTPQDLFRRIAEFTPDSTLIKDEDTNTIIGINLAEGGNFSLEPGGQVEYSSKPTQNLETLAQDVFFGLSLLEKAGQKEVLFLSHGTNPIADAHHPLVVPKDRYQFMTRYFQSAPAHMRGIDMMRYSATVQPNINIQNIQDWHSAVKLILQLVPITNQMFANSKFFHGKKSIFPSERQNIWDNMDPTRSNYPEGLYHNLACPQMECAYAQWAKKAYLIYIDQLPQDEQPRYGEITFEQWYQNGYKGIFPNFNDWKTHLSSLFPHLRLRQFLEIRNLDAQPFEHCFVTMAFYFALLKDHKTQKQTWDILKEYKFDGEDILNQSNHFEMIFDALLNLAIEISKNDEQKIAIRPLEAFQKFLKVKHLYWDEPNGLAFMQKHATFFPAQEFAKNLQF